MFRRRGRALALGLSLQAALGLNCLAAAPGYWLRLDDLRMPRPKSDEADPPPRPKEAGAKPKEPAVPERDRSAESRPAPTEPPPAAEENRLRIAGSIKGTAVSSRTPDAANESYSQFIGRLRLKLGYRFSPSLEAKLEHDTDLTTGNYLRTGYFETQKDAPTEQYFSSGSNWLDRRQLYGSQKFFRAYVKLTSDVADVVAGRQRIPLGTGRFWSTLDMLNPINPLQVERDEFVGVDAIRAERGIGALSKLSLVYAPDPAKRNDRWVAQYRTHVGESDVTVTYGKYWSDRLMGLDFATQVGDAGVRGELAYTRPLVGANYRKALLGFDYAFPNTLSFSSEIYYADRSSQDRAAQWAQNPQLALVQPLGGAYLGLAVGYDFTPVLKFSSYMLNNLKDDSRVFFPTVMYSGSETMNFMGGAQFFSGKRASEFGPASPLYFIRAQRFF